MQRMTTNGRHQHQQMHQLKPFNRRACSLIITVTILAIALHSLGQLEKASHAQIVPNYVWPNTTNSETQSSAANLHAVSLLRTDDGETRAEIFHTNVETQDSKSLLSKILARKETILSTSTSKLTIRSSVPVKKDQVHDSIEGVRTNNFGRAIAMQGPGFGHWNLVGVPLRAGGGIDIDLSDRIETEPYIEVRLNEFAQDFDFRHLVNPEAHPGFPSERIISLIIAGSDFSAGGRTSPFFFMDLPIPEAEVVNHKILQCLSTGTLYDVEYSLKKSPADMFSARHRLTVKFLDKGVAVFDDSIAYVSIRAAAHITEASYNPVIFVVVGDGPPPIYNNDTRTRLLSEEDLSTAGQVLPVQTTLTFYASGFRRLPGLITIDRSSKEITVQTWADDRSGLAGRVVLESSSNLTDWSISPYDAIKLDSERSQFRLPLASGSSFFRAIFERESLID